MENNQKQNTQPTPEQQEELESSLESTETTVVDGSSTTTEVVDSKDAPKKKSGRSPIKGLAARVNVYFLGFIFVMLLAGIISFVSYQKSKDSEKKQAELITEPLSQEDLNKLRQTDVKVGDPKQILSVESNAMFAGKVLVRDSLEVAGELKVGGTLSLPGISVSGASSFDQVAVNNLQVNGALTVQGQLNIQNNLGVSGNLTVGGTISAAKLNIQNLQIDQDLQISRHIDAGGGTPGKADGGALGAGGTSSVSGTDTAGTININTGGGTAPGCFVTVNFTQRFNNVPHIVVTPVGAAAGGLNWYINRTTTNFSVCTANAAPVGQNFAFDYIAID